MVYDVDVWFAINIIYELRHMRYYNVAQDAIIISIMNDRCSRVKSDVKRFDCEESNQKIFNSDSLSRLQSCWGASMPCNEPLSLFLDWQVPSVLNNILGTIL